MFAPIGLKCLSSRVSSNSINCQKCLGLILSHFRQHNCRNYASTFDLSIFDGVQMQKYLNYITNENSKKILQSNKLHELNNLIREKAKYETELLNLKNMSGEGDEELKKLIESEQEEFLNNIEAIKSQILMCISFEDENDERNVELQIISGIGGEEAKLFRNDLLQMYINYIEYKNWEYQFDPASGLMFISGPYVFGHLKHEGGVHRVQRVPETEKQNRVHTSTCSVVVLPQPKLNEIQILDKDIIVEKMRSSGPGGQNVNKTETCVRIKHIPSGLVVENQTSRFQYENKKLALERLRTMLFNIEQKKIEEDRKNRRKGQAGTNDYADKIRTYNFPQNRVTDHRLNYSMHNIKGFLSGTKDLDSLIGQLQEHQKNNNLINQIEDTLDSEEYRKFEKQQINCRKLKT